MTIVLTDGPITLVHPQTGVVFTFETGMIQSVTSNITSEPDGDPMPAAGPMQTMLFDFNGVTKTISVEGKLYDTTSSVLSNQSTAKSMQDKKLMKYWLEALHTGAQLYGFVFSTNLEKYSLSTSATMEFTDGVSGDDVEIAGTFIQTKCFIIKIEFTEEEANPSEIPFSMELRVAM